MKKIIFKIGLCAFAALVLCLPVQAANLLANPGFVPAIGESFLTYANKAPPLWSNIGQGNGPMPNDYYQPSNTRPMPSYNGSTFFYDLGGYGNPSPNVGDGVKQVFTTVPGHKYRLTFGLNSESNGVTPPTTNTDPYEVGADSMRVQVGDQDQVFNVPYQTNSPGYGLTDGGGLAGVGAWEMPWVTQSLVFTASNTTTTVTFTVASFSVNHYPDPNSPNDPTQDITAPNNANNPIIAMPLLEEMPPTSARLTIKKISLGDIGSFNFKGTAANANGFTTDNSYAVHTLTAGVAAAGATANLAAINTLTEIQETVPAGWVQNMASCVDANYATSGNPQSNFGVLVGSTLQIQAANVLAGADLQCTFTNTFVGLALSGKVIQDTGVGSGTAHDAEQNGSEPGHSGVTLALSNCSGTVYSTTTSGADGSFSLSLSGVPAGPVCLVETLPTGYNTVSVNVGTTGGTYTPGTTTLRFTLAANTAYSGVVLGDAPLSTLTSDGAQQAAAGQPVTYAHVYTAGSAGRVVFSSVDSPLPSGSVWTSVLYLDSNCNGTLDGGDTVLTAAINVVAGQQVCILDRVTSPAGAANGAQDITTVNATETWTVPKLTPGSQNHVLKNTDTTTVSSAGLTLLKDVRKLASCPADAATSLANSTTYASNGTARPGDFLEYRLRYSNNTAAPLTALKVYDVVPAYTQFVRALCLITPTNGISSCAVSQQPASGATSGSLAWTLGDAGGAVTGLQPSSSGSVSFCLQVQQ